MSRRSAPAETTSRGLLVLLLLYVILIGVILAFSRQLIGNIARASPTANTLALAVAVTFPLILFGIAAFQVVRLLRQRATRVPGAALKLRLTVYFGLIAVLCAGPQILLGVTFINSAMGTWFSASIGEALRGASRISIEYLQEKVTNIQSFADSQAAAELAAELRPEPRQGLARDPGSQPGDRRRAAVHRRWPGDHLPRRPAGTGGGGERAQAHPRAAAPGGQG